MNSSANHKTQTIWSNFYLKAQNNKGVADQLHLVFQMNAVAFNLYKTLREVAKRSKLFIQAEKILEGALSQYFLKIKFFYRSKNI